MKTTWRWVNSLIASHLKLFVLGLVFILVFFWTTFRFISNGVTFDVVGQIGVAEQWSHGLHEGALLGPTNYVLKMPIYSVSQAIPHLSPHARLYILALACNILTFWVLFWVGQKILNLSRVKNRAFLYLGILWLALIAGRVFWMDHANSRNLELAGGVVLLWLALSILEHSTWRKIWVFIALASCVFFADPLQLYTSGVGLGLFLFTSIVHALYRKGSTQKYIPLIAALVLSVAVSKVLFWLSTVLLPISYLQAPTNKLEVDAPALLSGFMHSLLRIFDLDVLVKPLGIVSLRHAVGIVLFAIVVGLLLRYVRALRSSAAYLFSLVAASTLVVYLVSGHASEVGTERYISMVAICLVFLFGHLGDVIPPRIRSVVVPIWMVCVGTGAVLLLGATVQGWPTRFSKDAPLQALTQYTAAHANDTIIASRSYANPTNYLVGYSYRVLPVLCTAEKKIVADTLFYDKAAWRRIALTQGTIHIVAPEEGIRTEQAVCSSTDLEKQFGTPSRTEVVPGLGTAYIYSAETTSIQTLTP